MRFMPIIFLLFLASCQTTYVEPEEKFTSISGFWQAVKDDVIDDINYKHYDSQLEIGQDANGILTIVGQTSCDYLNFDISGKGVYNNTEKSMSFSFTTNEVLINGIPTTLSGQFNANVIEDTSGLMLRGHLRINAINFFCVMHYRKTKTILWLPRVAQHNQGGIY